ARSPRAHARATPLPPGRWLSPRPTGHPWLTSRGGLRCALRAKGQPVEITRGYGRLIRRRDPGGPTERQSSDAREFALAENGAHFAYKEWRSREESIAMESRSAQNLRPRELVELAKTQGREAFARAVGAPLLLVKLDDPLSELALTLLEASSTPSERLDPS